jgi:mRNA-degrading endonuclease toxin of MazEF toxin-antitoxin module
VDKPERGRIIWHDFVDSTGRKRAGPHRAVIISSTDDIEAGKPIRVAVISSNLSLAATEDMVNLPFLKTISGHPHTKPNKKSAAICSWLCWIAKEDIGPDDYNGHVRGKYLHDILKRVKELDESC